MAKRKPRRSPNGAAKPYQRDSDGLWVVAIRHNGKRHVRYARTEDAAKVRRDQLLEQLRNGSLLNTTRQSQFVTVGSCVEQYINGPFAPVTRSLKRSAWKHAESALGHRPVHEVDAKEIRAWLRSKEGVGTRILQMAFDLVRSAFNVAIDDHIIKHNPCATVPRPHYKRKPIRPFNAREVELILSAASTHRLGVVFSLVFLAGLRQGEVFALKWSDIDWHDQMLTIRGGAGRTPEGGIELRDTKTDTAVRELPLPEPIQRALWQRAVHARKERFPQCDLICPTRIGTPMGTCKFATRVWKPLLRKLQLTERGLHAGRHTAATLLLRRGVPLHLVSQLIGHADPATTARTYSHVLEGDTHAALTSLSEAVGYSTATVATPQTPSKTRKNQVEDTGLEPVASCMPCNIWLCGAVCCSQAVFFLVVQQSPVVSVDVFDLKNTQFPDVAC